MGIGRPLVEIKGGALYMKRSILGRVVICLVIIGFALNFDQVAQARIIQNKTKTEAKKGSQITHAEKKSVAKKAIHLNHKEKKNEINKKIKTSEKKSLSRKHKMHADKINISQKNQKKHKIIYLSSHKLSSDMHANIRAVADNDVQNSSLPDLVMARESLERSMLMNEGHLDDRTLNVLESAFSYMGTPYVYGGTTPDGFDCSGFVKYVFKENGIALSRLAREQAQEGKPIHLSDLKPGDLIFFKMQHRTRDNHRVNHVGLYIGNGQFIHAASNPYAHQIKVDDLESSRYLARIVEVRRMLESSTDQAGTLTTPVQ
jgi:cell wall-associated NlpC family hydrolase